MNSSLVSSWMHGLGHGSIKETRGQNIPLFLSPPCCPLIVTRPIKRSIRLWYPWSPITLPFSVLSLNKSTVFTCSRPSNNCLKQGANKVQTRGQQTRGQSCWPLPCKGSSAITILAIWLYHISSLRKLQFKLIYMNFQQLWPLVSVLLDL